MATSLLQYWFVVQTSSIIGVLLANRIIAPCAALYTRQHLKQSKTKGHVREAILHR